MAVGCVVVLGGLSVGIARTGTSPVSFTVLGVAIAVTIVVRLLPFAAHPVPEPRFRTPAGIRALALASARRARPADARDRGAGRPQEHLRPSSAPGPLTCRRLPISPTVTADYAV